MARSNPPHGLAETIATLGAMLESASTIANDLAAANYRGLRVLRYVLGPLHDLWLETIRDAVALLEPEERAAARQILIEGLAAVDQVDGPRPR